jgi:hypothetical protein
MKALARRVMRYVLKSKLEGGLGYAPDKIILHGKSMGTGPATMLASEFEGIRALILQAPYISIREVVQ